MLLLQLFPAALLLGLAVCGQADKFRRPLANGIVVPKRSAIISGLDQQFKLRLIAKQQQSAGPNETSTTTSPKLLIWPPTRLATAVGSSRRPHSSANGNQQQQAALLLDRQQQEILAANPNLLNPASATSSELLTRADVQSSPLALAAATTTIETQKTPSTSQSAANTEAVNSMHSYRGYSLIELEVRNEQERRYIQDLYGNLSAVIDEQASNPGAITVSPYVDVDFWSFKLNALNDQIDIMVSPKSRSFILGQLARAKIRHRIKIDDIQSRLEQPARQEQPPQAGAQQQQLQLSARQGVYDATSSSLRSRQDQSQSGRQGQSNESHFFDNYQRLAEINQFLENMIEQNKDVAQVRVIGRSSQGRYLRVLKLGYDQDFSLGDSKPPSDPEQPQSQAVSSRQQLSSSMNNASYILNAFLRQQQSVAKLGSIWLDGGTHAREWISPSTVLYIANRLTSNHQQCSRFFDTLRQLVQVASNQNQNQQQSGRQARSYSVQEAPNSAQLDADLIQGINEINTSLLGTPVKQSRPRTELEHTLELLAKSPQDVATEYGCDLQIEQLLRRYTFLMQPVLNPDGYEYSHTHNRLWRKTRSASNHPIYRHFCLGADPNRNYDARHGQTGSSTHPCSQTYAGTVPFTEPETRHQSNFVYANRNDMRMYISFHSYSQMILLPFSHSKQLAPDHKDLESVGQAAVKAIEKTHGTLYRVGPSASILYTASGTASDWAYEKAGIKYSYTIELRDTGTYGFLLPRQQIIPVGEETFNGLLAMISQMEKNDNLLTSKSHVVGSTSLLAAAEATGSANDFASNSSEYSDSIRGDQSAIPPQDLDKLSSPPKNRLLANLENPIDGSGSWASPDLGPTGVRDRPVRLDARPLSTVDAEQMSKLESAGGDKDNDASSEDEELDSSYAFEGEGELMEPTRENFAEVARQATVRLLGRKDHTRKIVQAAGLTSTGRNTINSPLLATRTTAGPTLRETSENLVKPAKKA